MLGQQGHWFRLISSQTGSQPCLRPAAASSGLRRLLPLCNSSSSSATGGEGSKRRRTRQQRGRSKGASDQVQLNAAPEPLPAPDKVFNAAAAPAQPLDTANSAADARTAPAAQSLSELVPVPSGPRLEFPDAPFKLRPYQVDAIRSIIRSWKGGNNAQMVMLPTGCGKTVVFSALSRYMSEHYVAPAPASDTATPVIDASSSSAPSAPLADGGSAQGRGSPTVAAAATGDGLGAVSEAAQATASEADGNGSSSSRDDSSGTHAGSTSSAASDGDEDMLVGAVSRFQQLRQAATDSSGSTGASSTPRSQQRPQLGSSERRSKSSSTQSSSTQSRSRAGRQAAAGKSSRHSRSSSPSTPTLSNISSSPALSSREDESGSGNMRWQPPKQQQHPPPQQQQQQAEVEAPAGSMRVLVLAHRHELLHQAEEKFRLMWGSQDLSVSWVKGKRKEFDGQVVVASVATAVNCIPALRDCGFSLLIIDEAHHAVANTYKTVLEGLGLTEEVVAPADTQSADTDTSPGSSVSPSLSSVDEATDESFDTSDSISFAAGKRVSGSSADPEETAGSQPPRVITRVIPNPHQLLLGFTATPYRRMKRESEDLYAILRPTYTASISTMIRDNYLTQVSSQKIMTETDLQGIAVSKGDFVLGQLSPLVNSRSRNKLVLASYLEQCTEPDPRGEAARTPEQQRQHEIISRERARLVTVALQKSDRRKEAKAEEKRRAAAAAAAAAASAADTSDSSDEEPEGEEEEEDEEKEEGEMFPLPPGVTPEQLTGGLTMAGRRAVRRTIAFAVDIKHAEAMNVVFNAAGVHASAIHSMMPLDTMKQELARFRAGELDVLFNVEVLTEGFDEPAIDAILMARPTRSTGLYTQMLGRGLRIMPGKKDCLVLDFTDKYHQAGAVVDVRVLLEDIFAPKRDGPQQPDRGPARIDEGAEGGQVDLVERGIDPKDLAWRTIGPHCMTSIFSAGNVWLVNVAGMGPTQRVSLGLVAPNSRPVLQGERQQQDQAGGGGADAEDSDDEEDMLEDRYVILHQEQGDRDPDPCNWRVAYTPQNHTWRGFSKEDAYGTALTYIETLMRTEQAKYVARFVRAKRSGQGTPKGGYPHLSSFKQDAPWRGQAASEKQLAVLTRLGIAVAGPITKGQASDLISTDKCSLAEPAQRARLQDFLGNDLPVPLLKAHAEALLAAADTAPSSSSSS